MPNRVKGSVHDGAVEFAVVECPVGMPELILVGHCAQTSVDHGSVKIARIHSRYQLIEWQRLRRHCHSDSLQLPLKRQRQPLIWRSVDHQTAELNRVIRKFTRSLCGKEFELFGPGVERPVRRPYSAVSRFS